uniref:SH3 domain-containing protein n=1 Tax=Panagrolaimus sp. ES5 TaxID=591445 RepID=A0AC34G4Y4_9BILA
MDAYLNSTFSLRDLLEKQIPEELAKLEDSANRLERVAAFAEANYLNSPNKKQVFNETRGWTTQSLAGVAYQVNQLSSLLIRSLDLECENIASKVNEANNISQEIAISNERNARQQIGTFTHSKNVARLNKILYPSRRLKPPRHQFSEIDFNVLDNVGHAVKDVFQRPSVNRTNSILSGSDNMSSYSNQPPYDFLITRGNPNATYHQSNATSRATILPPSQLGSVSQYRLSIESTEGLPPPPAALSHPNDEPLPPPPFNQYQVYGTAQASTPDWVPANYIEKALAIYDYEAEKEDELNLRENCIVYVVAKNEDGWYEGVMDGMTGLFPSNYVQKI